MAAKENQVRLLGKFLRDRWRQRHTIGRKVNPAAARRLQLLDRSENRLGFYHHASAPAEGPVIGRPMLVGRPASQIMDFYTQQSRREAFAQNALGQKAVEHPGKERKDVDLQR